MKERATLPSNADPPIVANPSGRSMDPKEEQFLKALKLRLPTLEGIIMIVMYAQSSNDLVPMLATPKGIMGDSADDRSPVKV
jgi:hypothetical protein